MSKRIYNNASLQEAKKIVKNYSKQGFTPCRFMNNGFLSFELQKPYSNKVVLIHTNRGFGTNRTFSIALIRKYN